MAFVDLSGLGTGGAAPGPPEQASATDATQAVEARTITQEPASPRTQPVSAQPVTAPEKAVPVRTLRSNKAVSPIKPARRQSRPSKPAASPVQAKMTTPGPASEAPAAVAGPGRGPAGATGPGNGADGGSAGTGGGHGGGEGPGRGPGVGAGQGLGDAGGMSLAAVDVKPRIARQVEPDYPEEARRQGVRGRVVTRFLVTAEGGVARLSIVSADPPRVFDHAVLAAVGKWRFHPARFHGREVAAWVMLPIRFDLDR